jgi:hypothetical protein
LRPRLRPEESTCVIESQRDATEQKRHKPLQMQGLVID